MGPVHSILIIWGAPSLATKAPTKFVHPAEILKVAAASRMLLPPEVDMFLGSRPCLFDSAALCGPHPIHSRYTTSIMVVHCL